MKTDFVNFASDEIVIEVSDEQRIYTNAPETYPKDAAQKMFVQLERHLINNCNSAVSLLRVLFRYRQMVELMLNKTPNFMFDERIKLRRLFNVIMAEERFVSLTMIFHEKIIMEIAADERPTYSDEILVNVNSLKGKYIDHLLSYLSNQTLFERQIKFEPALSKQQQIAEIIKHNVIHINPS